MTLNDTMMQKFTEIEKDLESLIKNYNTVKENNLHLSDRINVLEQELKLKAEAEANFKNEQVLVHSRVDGLIIRLKEVN